MKHKLPINIFWFRRDLRLEDNAGLFVALNAGLPVLALFIFDTQILSKLTDKADKRVCLIHSRITELHSMLRATGSSLMVKNGIPVEIFKQICSEYLVKNVFYNFDYEPAALQRDNEVRNLLLSLNVGFKGFKDQVIFECNEIAKPDGSAYTVFTPYAKKWKSTIQQRHYQSYNSEDSAANFLKTACQDILTLDQIGFEKQEVFWPAIDTSLKLFSNYENTRNFPALESGTTNISTHLRFGTISVRKIVRQALLYSNSLLSELIWREFFMAVLYNNPHTVNSSFKSKYNNISWRNNEDEFDKWCKGVTGYPIVDAGMRQLNQTGLMHNRVRMITASFLVKHLLIDWRWGEAYFAQKLLDYEQASNVGNWQWVAGSGCDAAPYFRIFNPAEQTKRFDGEFKYINKWIPELYELTYPLPVVEHKFAYNRAIEVYKQALNE